MALTQKSGDDKENGKWNAASAMLQGHIIVHGDKSDTGWFCNTGWLTHANGHINTSHRIRSRDEHSVSSPKSDFSPLSPCLHAQYCDTWLDTKSQHCQKPKQLMLDIGNGELTGINQSRALVRAFRLYYSFILISLGTCCLGANPELHPYCVQPVLELQEQQNRSDHIYSYRTQSYPQRTTQSKG